MGKWIGVSGRMNKKKKIRKLEIDNSPPSPARRKVDAEILAFRALAERIKPWIKLEVEFAVKKAFEKMPSSVNAKR